MVIFSTKSFGWEVEFTQITFIAATIFVVIATANPFLPLIFYMAPSSLLSLFTMTKLANLKSKDRRITEFVENLQFQYKEKWDFLQFVTGFGTFSYLSYAFSRKSQITEKLNELNRELSDRHTFFKAYLQENGENLREAIKKEIAFFEATENFLRDNGRELEVSVSTSLFSLLPKAKANYQKALEELETALEYWEIWCLIDTNAQRLSLCGDFS